MFFFILQTLFLRLMIGPVYGTQIELFDALSTIDLAKPYRSTLNDNDDYGGAYFQAGDFSLSSGEMKRDLEDLNWMECYIHATETVGPADSEKNGARNPGMTSDVSAPKDLLASMASPIIRRSRSQKRKRRCFDRAAGEDPAVVVGGDYFLGAQEPADATTVAAKVKAEEGSTSLYVDTYHWDL
ncbi:hypothetical protein LINPERHAP2_LOCUS42898 [Linum perenne]